MMKKSFTVIYSDKDKELAEKFKLLGDFLSTVREETDWEVKEIIIPHDSYVIEFYAEGAFARVSKKWDLLSKRLI